jgi:hypothetical protein
MVMRAVAACVVATTMGGLACNLGAGPSDDVVILPDALTCASSSWNVIHDFGGMYNRPAGLRERDGKLYVSVDGLGVVSLPATGGEPVRLSYDVPRDLWISGASLYYTFVDGELMQMPIEGGTPAVVRDGKTPPWMSPSQSSNGVAFDANYFYWALLSGAGDGSLERTALVDGTTEQVATLPGRNDNFYGYAGELWAASADTLFLAPAANGVTYAMPLAGGAMRALAPPTLPSGAALYALGVNASGVLWSIQSRVTQTATRPIDSKSSLALSDLADPAGAAARPFWPGKPVGLRLETSYADGDRGWIAAGTETLADGSRHVSVWSIDAAGNGARLGCGPTLPDGVGGVVTAAVASDAVYAVVETELEPPERYVAPNDTLVRLDRARSK